MDKDKLRVWISDIISINLHNEPFHGTYINWPRREERLLDDLVEFVERAVRGETDDKKERRGGGRGETRGRPRSVESTRMWAQSKHQGAWDQSHTYRGIGGPPGPTSAGKARRSSSPVPGGRALKKNRAVGESGGGSE